MKLCLACKRWHDPLLDCKRAARMGVSHETKPVGSPQSDSKEAGKGVVRAEKAKKSVTPTVTDDPRDTLIAELKARIAELERYAACNAVTSTVTRTNAERQRDYRERKRSKA